MGLPWWLSGKEFTCKCRRCGFDPCVRKIPRRRKQQLIPVFLPGKSHGGGAWWATVHRVTKSQTQLIDQKTTNNINSYMIFPDVYILGRTEKKAYWL